MSTNPSTVREALVAELLGEVDNLARRLEALPGAIDDAQARLSAAAEHLDVASERYRGAIDTFNDQARVAIRDFMRRSAVESATKAAEEQRASMHIAARDALGDQFKAEATALVESLRQASRELRRSTSARLLEQALIAVIASVITASLVVYALR